MQFIGLICGIYNLIFEILQDLILVVKHDRYMAVIFISFVIATYSIG